ncbi:MAG: thioredoxin [Thermoplasmata archaeon]|jgi:thioredoxin 1|nr:thioredoxin [Thermoplasmata archaeon]
MSSEIEQIRAKKMAEMMNKTSPPGASTSYPEAPVPVSDASFEEFVKRYENVVVDCWAPWCGPCRMLSPTIDAMAKESKGKVVFAKLNTDENFETASKFRIMSIPTLLYFKNGQLVDKTVGALPRPAIESQIRKSLSR